MSRLTNNSSPAMCRATIFVPGNLPGTLHKKPISLAAENLAVLEEQITLAQETAIRNGGVLYPGDFFVWNPETNAYELVNRVRDAIRYALYAIMDSLIL